MIRQSHRLRDGCAGFPSGRAWRAAQSASFSRRRDTRSHGKFIWGGIARPTSVRLFHVRARGHLQPDTPDRKPACRAPLPSFSLTSFAWRRRPAWRSGAGPFRSACPTKTSLYHPDFHRKRFLALFSGLASHLFENWKCTHFRKLSSNIVVHSPADWSGRCDARLTANTRDYDAFPSE